MKIINSENIEAQDIIMEGVKNVRKRSLITEKDGAPNFALRLFELGLGGNTPYHKHPWEHEVFVLDGNGEVISEDGNEALGEGSVVFVPGEQFHQFKNTGERPFKFLCIVPLEGDK